MKSGCSLQSLIRGGERKSIVVVGRVGGISVLCTMEVMVGNWFLSYDRTSDDIDDGIAKSD